MNSSNEMDRDYSGRFEAGAVVLGRLFGARSEYERAERSTDAVMTIQAADRYDAAHGIVRVDPTDATALDRCTRALYQRDYGAWPPRPGNDADAYNADQCRSTAAVVLAALASEGGTGE